MPARMTITWINGKKTKRSGFTAGDKIDISGLSDQAPDILTELQKAGLPQVKPGETVGFVFSEPRPKTGNAE